MLQRRQGVAVTKPVFAIGDTTLLSQTRTGGPWEVTDTTRPLLLQGKSDDWLAALAQDGVSNEADRARRMLERNVADSTLQWAQPDEQMQLLQALVTQSAVYIARLRIGLLVRDEDYLAFQSVSQFDTYQISLCLGGYVQAAAEPMLNAIGREALRLNRDSIAIPHEPVHNESTPTQLNSREEAVTHDVHEEPRRLPDSEPFPAEPAEPVPEPLREAASGISGTERADALRPADAGGHAADELQPNRTGSTADGGQDPARADADHPDAGPQDEPAGLGKADQQPEEAGGGSSPSDAVRSLTEAPAQAESEQALSAFALPEFPPTLLPQLLAAETSSRADNAEYLTYYNKNPLLIDRLRFVRESYKDIFTELLLADDTRVGFHRQDNGLLVWQGAYLTRSAETLLSWRAVANALNDLIEQHELIAAIDPKELPQVEEQLSFELPDGSPTSAEDDRLEKDDFLTPEKQETVIRSALPVAEYNAPQIDDGSVITDEEVNLALAAGSNFESSKFRIYQQFTTTQGDHAAFLKKEYGSGGRSWDYQSGAHGWVDHGPAGLKLILTNEEGRFERRLPWRAAAKRIAYLIEMQRFLTQQELEQYPAWAAEQQEAASAVRDEPGNVPDTRPVFSVMQMVTNIMLRWPDDDIVLIDPEQEYTHLVTAMGGVVIDISASSPSHINPMDITEDYGDDEDPIRLKSQFLQNFCQLILHSSELSPQERTFIDVAAGLTYQRYMANSKREEMPTLHDFYRNLALQGEEVKPLLTALKLYVSGSMDLFAHQTNVNVQNHCICFNTVKLGKSMQSIGMLTVLDQVWNRITRNRVLGRRTWVFTDEFQQLLGNKDCTDFYFQLSSRARKWGAILTSITQHVRSVLDNEDARRMLSDCGYIKLLNQSPDDANDLARLLHISNEEKRYIENAEVGSGLLIVSKTVVPFNNDFPKDTELFRLMDTSPNRKS